MANKSLVFILCVLFFISINSDASGQDFVFGGKGNASNGFRQAIPVQIPGVTKIGVSGGNRTITPKGVLKAGYLNTFANVGVKRLPNGNDKTFNVVDVVVGDVNGDGFSDVIVASDDNPTTQINAPQIEVGVENKGKVTLFAGTGDGSFGLPISIETSSSPTSLAIGDLDGDSLADVVVGEIEKIEVFSTQLNANTFKSVNEISLPTRNSRVAAVDVKGILGRGFLDIIVALNSSNNEGGTVLIYPNNLGRIGGNPTVVKTQGTIGFASNKQIPANRAITGFQSNVPFPPSSMIGKADADIDIAVTTSAGLEIFENVTVANSGVAAFEASSTLITGENPTGIVLGDLNNDQLMDLVIINQDANITSYIANPTKLGYDRQKDFSVGKKLVTASLINFDADTQVDILVATTESIMVLEFNNGDFRVLETFSFVKDGLPIFNPSAVRAGIFDITNPKNTNDIVIADGFSDSSGKSGSTGGVLVLSSALGNQPIASRLFTNMSQATDFDSVGRLNDFAIIEQTTGTIFLLNNLSISVTANPTLVTLTPPTVSAISLSDILVNNKLLPTSITTFVDPVTKLSNLAITLTSNGADNENGILLVAINDGSGMFNKPTQFRQFVITSGATSIKSGDFRNTGFASDLAYVDYLGNLVGIILNDGANFFGTPRIRESAGFAPNSLAIADVNDDDFIDVIVLNSIATLPVPSKNSSVAIFLGMGNGGLFPVSSLTLVPGMGLSIAGGFGIIDHSFIPQIIDFNQDGLPDFLVTSTGGGTSSSGSSVASSTSLLVNKAESPGQFLLNATITLSDGQTQIDGKNFAEAGLALDASVGGAGLISGRGMSNLLGVGFGGANQTLAIADFNSDGSPDALTTGSFRINQAFNNLTTTSLNYRAASYLAGNISGQIRGARAFRITQYTLDGVATGNIAVNSGDTYIACSVGNFSSFRNFVLDTVHLSINGSLFVDANITSILDHAPIVTINRNDLNQFPGQGRKVILTSGESMTIPVKAFDIDGALQRFVLIGNTKGITLPFVKLVDKKDGTADIIIDTKNNGMGVASQEPLVEDIVVIADEFCPGISCERPRIPGYAQIKLVVKPKAAPTIAPIANVNIDSGSSQTIALQVTDKDNTAVTLTQKCDKDDYVSINGTTLTISPKSSDVGTNLCTLTATGVTGLFSTTSFMINVRNQNSPVINNVSFTNRKLVINGNKFGSTNAKAFVNGKDVTSQFVSQTDTVLTLKGNTKKLNLKNGVNQIVVTIGALSSNTFSLTLFVNSEEQNINGDN